MNIHCKISAVARISLVAIALLNLCASPAAAYVGPGVGLTAIGSLLALTAAVAIAIVAFVWFPLRRRMRARKQAAEARGGEDTDNNGSC